MINEIINHKELSAFLSEDCCENEVCVVVEENIGRDSYIILKVDEYYNSLNLTKTPPSIDCLFIRRCENGGFGLSLVELKKSSSAKHFDMTNIKSKFETTLFDFIQTRFNELLFIDYNDIKLYFVSNNELYKRDLGLKMDVLINIRFDFNGRKLMIHPKMPNPAIKRCY